jgi:hypothetical protein
VPLLLKTRLYLLAAVIMLTGLGSSVWIYLSAADEPVASMVDDYFGSKKYAHELVVYGGKLTLLADDFYRWFASLWHGRQLAYTVAAITAAISLGLLVAARSQPTRKDPPPPQ